MPVDIVTPGDGQEGIMVVELFDRLHEHAMASLEQTGNRLMSDAATVSKASDYDHLIYKNQIALASALGAREIGSEVNPGGPRKPKPAAE
jgi:hypothetical protein